VQVEISQIKLRPRQRQEIKDVEEMARSLAEVGLLQPVVLSVEGSDEEYFLVAGERRLRGAITCGWTHIEATLLRDLPLHLQQELEYEENAQRSDLLWWENAQAVFRYHLSREANEEGWNAQQTALRLRISEARVSQALQVARELERDPAIRSLAGLNAAYNYVQRKLSRELDAALELEIGGDLDDPERDPLRRAVDQELETNESADTSAPRFRASPSKFQVLHMDFREMAKTTTGKRRYNLVHCDFPYGIGMDTNALQGTREDLGRYADSADVYWELVQAFLSNQERICYDSCHCLFWFSMDYYEETRLAFENAGWRVTKKPLVWHKSDGKGIIPDPSRGPRNVYETALLASRGDRKVVRPVANAISFPTGKADADHLSEKPVEVLQHFFRMLVDETTELLDPTAGSGTAIRAALELKASCAIGLELDAEFARVADRRVRDALVVPGDVPAEVQIDLEDIMKEIA
jgi:ParB/RepB/Spo0J family partition protein